MMWVNGKNHVVRASFPRVPQKIALHASQKSKVNLPQGGNSKVIPEANYDDCNAPETGFANALT